MAPHGPRDPPLPVADRLQPWRTDRQRGGGKPEGWRRDLSASPFAVTGYDAGKVGNEKPIQIVREVWTSQEPMLTVQARDFDP